MRPSWCDLITTHLTRRFGDITAVDQLSLGLVRPTSSEAQVLGSSLHSLAHQAARVGALSRHSDGCARLSMPAPRRWRC